MAKDVPQQTHRQSTVGEVMGKGDAPPAPIASVPDKTGPQIQQSPENLAAENQSLRQQVEEQKRLVAQMTLQADRVALTDGSNKTPPSYGARSALPSHALPAQTFEADDRFAITRTIDAHSGKPGPGNPAEDDQLFLITLPGHKSRVVDPARGTAHNIASLPVWAHNSGEAWLLFMLYNGIVGTVNQPKIEAMPKAA